MQLTGAYLYLKTVEFLASYLKTDYMDSLFPCAFYIDDVAWSTETQKWFTDAGTYSLS